MEAEDIIAKARARTGIEQFDSESFREGLELAAQAVDRHPDRTPEGKAFLEELYVGNLAKRLRIADWARRHPDEMRPIERPLIVMGMPRTGTTLVSYLLSADRKRRSLLNWELDAPVPPPTTEILYDNPVIDAKRERLQGNPYHYEEPDGPTECAFVNAHDFKSLYVEAMSTDTEYSKWVLEADMTSAYEYHKLLLQVLQSRAPGSWNLKMPSHAIGIEALFATYPDARVVWCHRDPFQATGSLLGNIRSAQVCSLAKTDYKHLAATYPYQLHEHVRRPMVYQDKSAQDPFYHVFYADMVRDPIGEMRKLHDWLGEELTDDGAAAMNGWLAANPQGRFGKHAYNLQEFGLTKAALMPYFEDYLARFDIEMEG